MFLWRVLLCLCFVLRGEDGGERKEVVAVVV